MTKCFTLTFIVSETEVILLLLRLMMLMMMELLFVVCSDVAARSL